MSSPKKTQPYGTWLSPINSSLIAEGTITFSEVKLDTQGDIYWLELRPTEAGRYALMCDGEQQDIIQAPFNCRTRVHEYGGGTYIVYKGMVYFSNFADQRIYQIDRKNGNTPVPLTCESNNASIRFADATVDFHREQLITVCEDHIQAGNVINTIAVVSLTKDASSNQPIHIVSGHDFYSSPRLSPDNRRLVWISWSHPNMPWDNTELFIGEFDLNKEEPVLTNVQKLVGGENESIIQPKWSPDGKFIYFISDKSGWWNLYRTTPDGLNIEQILEMQADFGRAASQIGLSFYDFDASGNIVAVYIKDGSSNLVRIDTQTHTLVPLVPTEVYTDIFSVRIHGDRVYFIGGSPIKPTEVVEFNMQTNTIRSLRRSTNVQVDECYLSVPAAIKFESGNETAYAFYYPPKNDDYEVLDKSKERPPLLVRAHGGPISATSSAFSLSIQYWTSRGFALLDVNYRGSTGYGRAYRERLKRNWGIVDVEDCIAGARYLVEQGKVDKNRLTIDGRSAGGYTTLCALTMHNYFSAGASHFGLSDLELFVQDTHKFESYYLDSLVGEYPAEKSVYIERSPIHHAEKLSKPIIFFQGSEDKIVLPNQAEIMVNALKQKHVPVAYLLFDGEQHGFRKTENIKRSLDAQFYFFSKIFKFQMADAVEPVHIENLTND
jgi:dipeptidyl aminopeptidase/acylaminoacyl peptidase